MFDAVGSPPVAAALDDKAAGSRAASLAAKAGAESVFVVLLLLGAVPAYRTWGSAGGGLVRCRRPAGFLLSESSGDSGELPSA
jgi:hypothetical protein